MARCVRRGMPVAILCAAVVGRAAEPTAADAVPRLLVPGFIAEPLPLDLPNVNFLRYRSDGTLVAGGYDGTVWLLRDTDGDGLEDRADEYFKSPTVKAVMGLDVTPAGDPRGPGVFVAAPGRVVFLPDADADGRADREVVVASGWPPPKFAAGGVSDTLGVAVGPDGDVWFGIGTDDFSRAYLVDEQGKARYDVAGERGTIQRVAADFSSRTTVCSGIRFPVGLAFNAAGDLFCTDQEGATWLPNGNPLDELLWILPNRHYGFPPRHPRHLPDVIDEPSVVDFRPQHQSTCGLCFDLPAATDRDGPIFGPAWWRGDAVVCGESRGKLWRVELEKLTLSAGAGYAARTQLVASLPLMPIDAAVSPRGDLVVTCHSGKPDWGSGPAGRGRLFRIRHARPDAPQPRFAFTPEPGELRIVFDRPLEASSIAGAAPRIEFGPSVGPGDRFETLRPGYAVVRQQQADPRHPLAVEGVRLADEGRTLVVATRPHRVATSHAVTLAVAGTEIDLGYAPGGVTAEWRDPGGRVGWSGWLPHVDTRLARRFTAGSPDHDRLWRLVETGGELTLATTIDLRSMLRPEVQRGSTLDHEPLPPEEVTVAVTGGLPLHAGVELAALDATAAGPTTARFTAAAAPRPWAIRAATGPGFQLAVEWWTAEDSRPRPLPLGRLWLPWTEAEPPPAVVAARQIPEDLAGGSWARGWHVFFGSEGNCGACHAVHGRGGWVGPDLSNLAHRDHRAIRRDIVDPSAAINPEHVAHVVTLVDGRVLSGIVRPDGDGILLGAIDGTVTRLARSEIEELRPAMISIMPSGIPEKLGPEKMRDLLVFLCMPPPRMPDYGPAAPPEPRSRAEVARALAGGTEPAADPRPLRLVLVAGPKDHGPGAHDYPAWQRAWAELLAVAPGVEVDVADRWPTPEQLAAADAVVFYQRGEWTPTRAAGLDAFLARGGGAVFIHWAVDGGRDPAGCAERIGLAWQDGRSRYRHGPLALDFGPGAGHPIARNLSTLALHDESYWNLVGDATRIAPLARGREAGADQPLVWVREAGRGRVFCSIPGHFAWSFDDPLFRLLILRGIAWAAGEGVDRFDDLVLPGARVAD